MPSQKLIEQLEGKEHINLPFLKHILAESHQKLPHQFILKLVDQFKSIVRNEPNVLKINDPVMIIGDIHGQFGDLLKLLSLGPQLEDKPDFKYLFLGDYVDRGPMGMECSIYIMAMKVKFPKQVFLLRGNHESRRMTQMNNFYNESCQKYDQDIYFEMMDAFDALPLACIVDQKYFCVHAGICADGSTTISDLDKINRFDQIPLEGAFCDLMWSDPVPDSQGRIMNGSSAFNEQRNCSVYFGAELAHQFLKKNKLITIIRGHEVPYEGYKQFMWPGWNNIPTVYTIFSAPNYCGTHKNTAALLFIENCKFSIKKFTEYNPKLYVPQKFNVFSISLPRFSQFMDKLFYDIVAVHMKKQLNDLSKEYKADQLLGALLKFSQDNAKPKMFEIKPVPSPGKKREKIEKGEDEEVDSFKRSLLYFKEKEMMPVDQIVKYKE